MKRALVAAALGGLLMVGTPTLALSAQRNDTRAEKGGNAGKGGDKGDNKGDKADRGDKGDRGDRGDRGHRGDRGRHGHHRHGDYYDNYYGYPYYGGYYGGYDPYYGGGYGYGGARGKDVLVRGLAFNPPESNIRPGEDVTWVFNDREPHTVTADNRSFDSGERNSGEFRLRFDEPGTYSYHCAIHPDMKGRVLVG
jgi:hypothetical protein